MLSCWNCASWQGQTTMVSEGQLPKIPSRLFTGHGVTLEMPYIHIYNMYTKYILAKELPLKCHDVSFILMVVVTSSWCNGMIPNAPVATPGEMLPWAGPGRNSWGRVSCGIVLPNDNCIWGQLQIKYVLMIQLCQIYFHWNAGHVLLYNPKPTSIALWSPVGLNYHWHFWWIFGQCHLCHLRSLMVSDENHPLSRKLIIRRAVDNDPLQM